MTTDRRGPRARGGRAGLIAPEQGHTRLNLATRRLDPVPGEHALLIKFAPDGRTRVYVLSDDRAELARHLENLVRLLIEHPTALARAAGLPEDTP